MNMCKYIYNHKGANKTINKTKTNKHKQPLLTLVYAPKNNEIDICDH